MNEIVLIKISSRENSQSRERERSPSKGKGKGQDRVKSPARGQPTRGSSPSGKTNRTPCKWHLKGNCKHGETCDQWHIPVCKFFTAGKCNKDKCVFLHPENANAAEKPSKKVKDGETVTPKNKAKAKVKAKAKKEGDAACAFSRTKM